MTTAETETKTSVPSAVRAALNGKSGNALDDATVETLYAQVTRVLEPAMRSTRMRPAVMARARALARRLPVRALRPATAMGFVLAVRDEMKAHDTNGGGKNAANARAERLDRAAEITSQALIEHITAEPAPKSVESRDASEQAHGLLQRLVSVMPDAVVTLKRSGALGHWSVGATRITGRRRREVQRRGLTSVFRDSKAHACLLRDLDRKGRVTDHEVILVNASGEDVPVRVFATRLQAPDEGSARKRSRKSPARRTPQSDDDRYLLVLHDMTEVQRIRRRLIETEKLSAMAKVAGSVAHEFRNPLNSLFLNTDLLEDELEGHREIRRAIAPTLSAIREEIERLDQIITHYLSLSKVASTETEVMSLSAAVRDFAGEWTERAAERNVQLRVRCDEEVRHISADPNQVRRILVNLVENAFDAVADRELKAGRTNTVTLLVRSMRRSVKLTVKDNGPGIAPEVRERVFEPFYTSKSGGSGLGLYLVREIVLAGGGWISLSSGDGRGTSVSVRWPIPEEERA